MFFLQFYTDIYSSPLIRNLQYLQDYMYNPRGYPTLYMFVLTLFQFTDFKNYAMSGSIKDNPKLERSIALFNGLSQWIQCMVLSKTTPQQRADVIVKFVNVAKVMTVYCTCKTPLVSLFVGSRFLKKMIVKTCRSRWSISPVTFLKAE